MLKKYLFVIGLLSLILSGCQNDVPDGEREEQETGINEEDFVRGLLRIKVTEELAGRIESSSTRSGGEVTRAMGAEDILAGLDIFSIERTFPDAGPYETRTRAAGLHLWYDVEFNESRPLTRAHSALSSVKDVTIVEYRPVIIPLWDNSKFVPAEEVTLTAPMNNGVYPFNDPGLKDQWHYYNDGTRGANYVAGADINVLDVWKYYTTGSPEVIVAIVDGGIDITHPDLMQNLWKDANGYHGYNYHDDNRTIIPDQHGTHVAGTVAAVNNNGTGVAGIAGGNGSANSGVRLMSQQIFVPDANEGRGGARAIKEAADKGAIICQNSWGYKRVNQIYLSDKEAIDYFIDNAGSVTGPMLGGLVIFSFGNEQFEGSSPGSYERVIGVTSLAGNFTKASYSNYATTADLAAPGGDQSRYGTTHGVMSTTPGNTYSYMQGTSMAAPHVSGVAALVVSYFGGPGFTADALREKLENTATNINDYNPPYRGKLGKGLVNALGAVSTGSTVAPDPVTSVNITALSNTVTLKWRVPADADDYKAASFQVFCRKTSLAGINLDNPPVDVMVSNAVTGNLNVGDELAYDITELDFGQEYFFKVRAYDYSRNYAPASPQVSATTGLNTSPVITLINGSIDGPVNPHETIVLDFDISDPDGHDVTYAYTNGSAADDITVPDVTEPNSLRVTIKGNVAPAGTYKAVLTVTDKYGLAARRDIDYTINPNFPPRLPQAMPDVYRTELNKEFTATLSDYFADDNGEPLSFTVSNSNTGVVSVSVNQGVLSVIPMKYGSARISVTARDAAGEEVTGTFTVVTRNAAAAIDLFPNPVSDKLNIRGAEAKDCTVKVYNSAGAKVREATVNVNPFAPGSIDLSGLPGGIYNVVVRYDGKDISNKIVKL